QPAGRRRPHRDHALLGPRGLRAVVGLFPHHRAAPTRRPARGDPARQPPRAEARRALLPRVGDPVGSLSRHDPGTLRRAAGGVRAADQRAAAGARADAASVAETALSECESVVLSPSYPRRKDMRRLCLAFIALFALAAPAAAGGCCGYAAAPEIQPV